MKKKDTGEISTQAVPSIMESGSDDVKTPDTPETSREETTVEDSEEAGEPEGQETPIETGNELPFVPAQ